MTFQSKILSMVDYLQTILLMSKDANTGIPSNLAEYVAALSMDKQYTTLSLEILCHENKDYREIKWKIWDGTRHYESPSLRQAYLSYCQTTGKNPTVEEAIREAAGM